MKKTLLAAALLTGGFAGTAIAQNSVTLYGRIGGGLGYTSIKLPSDNAAINEIRTASDRFAGGGTGTFNQFAFVSGYAPGAPLWGLRGVEDLGNGLQAQFQFESGVDIGNGSTSGFDRVAAVRLASASWGTVGLGRDVNAAGAMTSGVDPFGAGWGYAGADDSMGIFGGRSNNMLRYTSPSISGFQGSISYSFNGNPASSVQTGGVVSEGAFGTTNKNRFLSAGLRYANGPVLVSAAVNQAYLANNTSNTSPTVWLLGGTYDLKVVKLHAAFGQSIDGLVGNAKAGAIGFGGVYTDGATGIIANKGSRTNNWMAGVSVPVGDSGSFLASFQQQRPGGNWNDVAGFATQSIAGFGYNYRLSARTSLWASYNYASNLYMLSGVKSNQFGVGVVHNF